MMNGTERLFYQCALEVCSDNDIIRDMTGTWVDTLQGIDFFWNGLAIDTTNMIKDRKYLHSIKEMSFKGTPITGFIKSSNGHHDLAIYVLVLELNGCSREEMRLFCSNLEEVESWYIDTIDLYEETHEPKVQKSMSWFLSPVMA